VKGKESNGGTANHVKWKGGKTRRKKKTYDGGVHCKEREGCRHDQASWERGGGNLSATFDREKERSVLEKGGVEQAKQNLTRKLRGTEGTGRPGANIMRGGKAGVLYCSSLDQSLSRGRSYHEKKSKTRGRSFEGGNNRCQERNIQGVRRKKGEGEG